MRPFESRAIENIAKAPATDGDRRWAAVSALILILLFAASIPFSRWRLGEVPAFVPTVVGAGVVALLLTAVLLYVQYRIERDLRLALLAIAYGFAAVTQTLYVLTFPGLFTANGLLGAGSADGVVVLHRLAGRFRRVPDRARARGPSRAGTSRATAFASSRSARWRSSSRLRLFVTAGHELADGRRRPERLHAGVGAGT